MGANSLKAVIRPQSMRNDGIEDVRLDLFNMDGTPFVLGEGGGDGGDGGGGAGLSVYIDGHGLQSNVIGTSDYLYFDGSANNLDIVGIPLSDGQSIELPPGIYTSSWQIGFDVAADDGVGDTTRLFSAQVQPAGKLFEKSWVKPAGGWADSNPYIAENLGWNFIIPDEGNDLIVSFDGSTANDNGVTYYLSFTVIKLGDIPE